MSGETCQLHSCSLGYLSHWDIGWIQLSTWCDFIRSLLFRPIHGHTCGWIWILHSDPDMQLAWIPALSRICGKKKIRLAQHALAQEHTFFALQPSCPFCHFLEAVFWYITTLQLCPYVQKWVSYGGLNFSIGDSDMALPIIVACGGSGTMCQPSGADLGHPMQQFEWRLCKQHLAPYAIFSCSSCTWHVFCHILLM